MIVSARAGARDGSLRLFRGGVLVLLSGPRGVAVSSGPGRLTAFEALAGGATAALVALIVPHYEGGERTLVIGTISAVGGAFAMLLAGVLSSAMSWRLPFWILAAAAALVLVLSRRLEPSPAQAGW